MTATVLQFPAMDNSPELDAANRQMPNRVREMRKRRQWTLRELGERAGIAYGHLSRIEKGNSALNDGWLDRLSAALSVMPADLLPLKSGGLTDEERTAIDTLRQVPAANRQSLLAMIASQQPYRIHDTADGANVADLNARRTA